MPIPNSKIVFGKALADDLFSEIAKEKSLEIFQGGLKKDRDGQIQLDRDRKPQQEKNNSTQLRKFYDELVMWTDKVHNIGKLESGQKSNEVREARYRDSAPFIKMMNAKVAYAKGRNHVDESFEAMFSHCIKSIADADSLKHAKLFMEAFMGFYKAQEK
ncbi:MAG: type III-A CRISPR-associated protein Csm2 [Rhodoferax sp.]|nr:type III-A CRISPR-associated protein Csm2 [Rhodoferax sp.]